MKPYKSYDKYLLKALKDPKEAAAYLNAALEEDNPKVFLMAYYAGGPRARGEGDRG